MEFPAQLLYTKEHEWILRDGDQATVGITDHAQHELGDVVFVELPEVGAAFKAGEAFGSLESVKAVSDAYIPIDGEITEVNETLLDAPEKINEDAYGKGWIIRIRVKDPSQLDSLMSSQDYQQYLQEESSE